MKTSAAILFCAVLISVVFLGYFSRRPLKIVFLESIIRLGFAVSGVPSPRDDPHGWVHGVRDWLSWVHGVRRTHLNFNSVSSPNDEPEQLSKDIQIELKDGRSNWIRVFSPVPLSQRVRKDYPVFLWFHGGGYCLGNYTYEDNFLFPLSQRLDSLIISVDYRLAPEFKFPSAIDDAYLSFHWIHDNIHTFGGDNSKIFVGGESSGASISMAIAHLLRENAHSAEVSKPSIKGLYLNCPGILLLESESYREYREGYILDESWLRVFMMTYVNKLEDWKDPKASPLNMHNLSGLPHALVHISNLDVVRDGSLYLVERLEKENPGKVHFKVFDNIPHAGISSFRWLFKKESDEAIEHVFEWVQKLLEIR
jgi:acetyl esterase/lipase